MTPERWREITEVFHASLQGDRAGRDGFLDRVCAGDRALRAEVDAMLKAHEHAGSAAAFLDQSCAGAATPLRTAEALSQYRVVEQAGSGGMSVVYKALDIKLDRHVALKFLPEEFAANRQALERFQREARAVAALDHPNICTIHSIAEDSGRPFIVMQWVDGETLREKIGSKPLPISEVLRLGVQIADALATVHAQGIIHRDIKPANLMVTREGQAKILDFGIAKVSAPERQAERKASAATDTGMVVGTAGYMSPEQVLGQPLDARSDLFAFGAVLYEMATGAEAFGGETPGAVSDAILHRRPPAPSTVNATVPPGLERIIDRALEKAPERRYQSARELASDLAALGQRDSTVGGAHRPRTRRQVGWILAVAALSLGLAAAVGWARHRAVINFEPLPAVAASHPKPGQPTTSSVEALKLFGDASGLLAKRRYQDARVLLKRAVEINPEFTQAYASLGSTYASRDFVDDSRQAEHYFQEALKRLDRVSERERLEIQATYHASVGDETQAASYCRLLVDAYPKVSRYRFNLANSLRSLRQYPDAIREYETFLRLEPNSPGTLINIAVSYAALEEWDHAAASYERAFALSPNLETDLIFNHQYGWLQVVRGQEDKARGVFTKMFGGSGPQKARGHRSLGILALYHGRFGEARQHLEEASRLNDVNRSFDSAGRDLLYLGDALVLVGRTEEGVHQLDRAMALFEKGSSERGALVALGNAYARAGHAPRAGQVLALLKTKARPGNFADTTLVLYLEGELALARHATEESVETLRRARSAVDATATDLSLASGLTRTGHSREAIELYERVIAKPAPAGNDQVRWALAHRELGRLYEASGHTDQARAVYLKLLALWADADPGLPRLEDVRRAVKRLGHGRG